MLFIRCKVLGVLESMYSLNHHHTGKISLVPLFNPCSQSNSSNWKHLFLPSSVALQECHTSRIMQYSVYLVRLLFVEIILLRFVLLHVSTVHTFLLLNHTPLCRCTTIFLFTSQQTSKLCMILDHWQIKLQQRFRYRLCIAISFNFHWKNA